MTEPDGIAVTSCFILHHGWFATVVRSVSVLRSRVLAPEFSPSTLPPDRHSTDSSDLPLPGSCSSIAFATLRCLFSPGLSVLAISRSISLGTCWSLCSVNQCQIVARGPYIYGDFPTVRTMAGNICLCIRFRRLLLMRFCPLRTPHERK